MEKNEYLTDRERQVFVLYFKRGWRIEDIAQELEPPVTRSTVDRLLRSIRQKTIKNI